MTQEDRENNDCLKENKWLNKFPSFPHQTNVEKKKSSNKSQILDIEEKAGFTRKKRKMVFFELILCQALWYAFQTHHLI